MWDPYETLTDPSVLDSDRYETIPVKIVITLIKYWPIFLTAYAADMLRYSIPWLKKHGKRCGSDIGERCRMRSGQMHFTDIHQKMLNQKETSPKSTSYHKPKDEN